MRLQLRTLVAPVAIVAVLAVACGNDDDTTASRDTTSETTAADQAGDTATDSAASDLRAALTSLLQEHVYLAGAAISTAVSAGGDLTAPAVKSATDTLDGNSVDLSKAVASVYGDDAGAQFLALWRAHIGMFVDYTLGGATGDAAKQQKAKAELDQYRQDLGAFVESATKGELRVDQVAAELQVHVNTLVAAVDAVLAKDPSVFPKLREAAQHMPKTAAALAGAIAAANPDTFGS